MSSTIHSLLSTMTEERKKSKADEDDEFVVVHQADSQWPTLFDIYFLSSATRLPQISTCTTNDDDLVFYVPRKAENDQRVEVFRHHDLKRRPKLASPDYDWEETTYLNLILHQFEYTVTTAVCVKTSAKHLQILQKLSTRVYANPSRRDMENKGTEEKITYPKMYFTVDNFEDIFCNMFVNEGQMVCVELVAKNPVLNTPKVLFLGSIKYEALKKVYETRETTSTRVAQRMTLGRYTKRRVEFVKMRGPNGKGHAEMAVSRFRPIPSVLSTPESSPTTPVKSSSDEEDEERQGANPVHESVTPPVKSPSASSVTTSEIESQDLRQELADGTGGFLGRTLTQAISWVRSSSPRQDQSSQASALQTCLTFLTLPCDSIMKDILESTSTPLLTPQS